jgi:hypothetical protein
MSTLELWEEWRKLGLYRARPELGMDGTNDASERSIVGRSKVRYKTTRGYKSLDGMSNGIALTRWLYDGEDEHKTWRKRDGGVNWALNAHQDNSPKFAHRLWDSYSKVSTLT